MPQRVAIETWDPEFGAPLGGLIETGAEPEIDPGVEAAPADWRPIRPDVGPAPSRLVFVDGVRRTEAHAWIEEESQPPRQGILASCAAGATVVEERARVAHIEVRRCLFAPGNPQPFRTRAGEYRPGGVVGEGADALSAALQEELGALEIEVAGRVGEAELIVVDGPLYGRAHLPRTVGYIKTHRVRYLDGVAGAAETVAALEPGERTPVFRFRTSWTRNSWYLRLPGPRTHSWSGIVRLESAADAPPEETRALADRTAALLPRFASTPHKDPRAPQNLFPIAGLERELRHRLGDPAYVRRALRAAAG